MKIVYEHVIVSNTFIGSWKRIKLSFCPSVDLNLAMADVVVSNLISNNSSEPTWLWKPLNVSQLIDIFNPFCLKHSFFFSTTLSQAEEDHPAHLAAAEAEGGHHPAHNTLCHRLGRLQRTRCWVGGLGHRRSYRSEESSGERRRRTPEDLVRDRTADFAPLEQIGTRHWYHTCTRLPYHDLEISE